MRRLWLCVPLFLVGCRPSDEIQTYRVSKEPEAPLAAATQPSIVDAPGGAAPELPAGHPAIGDGVDMQAMGAGMRPEASAKEVSWKAPAGWKEKPAGSIRVGSFDVPGEGGPMADVSVIPLSGDAGGDLANVNRWRGQISLPPLGESDLPNQSQTISPAGRRMLLVNYSNQGKRLIAAVYKHGGRTWFFKMTGPDATVQSARLAFLQFLESLKFHD